MLKTKLGFVVFLILCIGVVGCSSIKRKFVRKKKDDTKNKVVAVLDPIDYQSVERPAQEHYKYHYSMWTIWQRELEEAITHKENNDKRYDYLTSQIIEQLNKMKEWIDETKQAELQVLIDEMKEIEVEFSKPEAMRNQVKLRNSLLSIAKRIRLGFKVNVLEGHFQSDSL